MFNFLLLSLVLSYGCSPEVDDMITYPSTYVVENDVSYGTMQSFILGNNNELIPYTTTNIELASAASDLRTELVSSPLEFLNFDRFELKSPSEIAISSAIPGSDFFGKNLAFPFELEASILTVQGYQVEFVQVDNSKFKLPHLFVMRKRLNEPNNDFLNGSIATHTFEDPNLALKDYALKSNYQTGDTLYSFTFVYDFVKQ
jgi:hypothetical protein